MKKSIYIIITCLLLLSFALGGYCYSLSVKNNVTQNNNYNYSFSELVNKINNIENYLAKSMISKSTSHSGETLNKIWSDSDLAIVYFENIPFIDNGTNKSIKFLNQLSDYTYTLFKKTIKGQTLTDEDLVNLKSLYKYASTLKDVLNELSAELNDGSISWKDLNEKTDVAFDNEEINIFSNIENNFDDYEGLIYDGAYSDYITKSEKLGLTGEEVDEETAKSKIQKIFAEEDIQEIISNGEINGDDIECYSFVLKTTKSNELNVDISKKGGWVVNVLCDKNVEEEKISSEDAINIGKEYLSKLGYSSMKETYYTKIQNVITVNYAYEDSGIVMYPDLIKVKVALDDGDILGLEATGYLNNHINRDDLTPSIDVEKARSNLNDNLEILSEGLVVIPNEDKTQEIFCYEFKGKIEEKEFLIYINANTGEEEEILIILETEGGILTI